MCISESIIHCYLDHELPAQMVDNVTAHINSCSECDAALLKAKQEAAIVEFALAYEMALPVPTKRLVARIEAAISATSR